MTILSQRGQEALQVELGTTRRGEASSDEGELHGAVENRVVKADIGPSISRIGAELNSGIVARIGKRLFTGTSAHEFNQTIGRGAACLVRRG